MDAVPKEEVEGRSGVLRASWQGEPEAVPGKAQASELS